MQAMIAESYDLAFAAWKEVKHQWILVEEFEPNKSLDPAAVRVRVYDPPDACGNSPPDVCWSDKSVQDLYDDDFACTPENDVAQTQTSFYQAKCHADDK